jgi:hypothetical protein
MDVNGTRSHVLLGHADWARCDDEDGRPALRPRETGGVEWRDEVQELSLRREPFEFPAAPRDRPPARGDRRGADADRFGNVYWIDGPGTGIQVRSAARAGPAASGARPTAPAAAPGGRAARSPTASRRRPRRWRSPASP